MNVWGGERLGGERLTIGAAPSFSGVGRGRVENFRGRGGPGQPFPPGPGRGGAGRASLLFSVAVTRHYNISLSKEIFIPYCRNASLSLFNCSFQNCIVSISLSVVDIIF